MRRGDGSLMKVAIPTTTTTRQEEMTSSFTCCCCCLPREHTAETLYTRADLSKSNKSGGGGGSDSGTRSSPSKEEGNR